LGKTFSFVWGKHLISALDAAGKPDPKPMAVPVAPRTMPRRQGGSTILERALAKAKAEGHKV
jgi:hypothetical protein